MCNVFVLFRNNSQYRTIQFFFFLVRNNISHVSKAIGSIARFQSRFTGLGFFISRVVVFFLLLLWDYKQVVGVATAPDSERVPVTMGLSQRSHQFNQSYRLWRRVNPGFVDRKPPKTMSQATFVGFEPDTVDREYFHRRDNFTEVLFRFRFPFLWFEGLIWVLCSIRKRNFGMIPW
jgi:hypothetical protein